MAFFRPMHDMLMENKNRMSLHMPGHKGYPPFEAEPVQWMDTTELPVTDDLYAPFGPIDTAQKLMAKEAGAGHTLMLTGGSTAGILTMLLYCAQPGDTVILPRNAHLSCMNGCILGDLHPVFVPLQSTEDGYAYAPENGFLQAIAEHKKAKAVLVTRPDFYGGAVPLARIAAAAHENNMRLIVDEAHGAHWNWMQAIPNAGRYGADLWVQSAHKTLPALTAGSWLHLAEQEDMQRARRLLRMVQTSSPAFYILQSLDDARAFMAEKGAKALSNLCGLLRGFRDALPSLGYADAHSLWKDQPLDFDPTRLVIAAPQGGYALAKHLQSAGIDVEMADDRRIVCILSVTDGEETFLRLKGALATMIPEPVSMPAGTSTGAIAGRALLSPRAAALSELVQVPAEKAAGCVSGASVGLYPPGIPLVVPGEVITPEIVARLNAAPEEARFGLQNGRFLCVKL